jgi:hypothetical protein
MSHSDYKNLYEGYLDNTGYNNRNIRENYAVGFTNCSGNGYWGLFESTNSKITRCKNANKNSNCAYDSGCGVIPLFNKELNFQIQINNNTPKSVEQTLTIEANVGDIIQLTGGSFIQYNVKQMIDGISGVKTYYNVEKDSVYDYINTGGNGVFEVIGELPPGIKRGKLETPGYTRVATFIKNGKTTTESSTTPPLDTVVSGTPEYNGTFSGKIQKPPNTKTTTPIDKPEVKNKWIYMFTIKLNYTDPSGVVIYQEKKIQFNIYEKY